MKGERAIKEHIIRLFEESRGKFLSGGEIAAILGISRAAVWKWVQQLRVEGYRIESVHGKGYLLSRDSDILSAAAVCSFTRSMRKVVVLPSTESTNTVAKELAASGAKAGTAVLAEEQTAGRGRRGRSFFSPGGTGLYMSVIVRPGGAMPAGQYLTAGAAVAVTEALRALYGVDAHIKWVNDILISGKKVCGILCEGSFSLENGRLDYAVVGIGINLTTAAFPEALSGRAASLSDFSRVHIPRAQLAGEILNRLDDCLSKEAVVGVLTHYKALSCIVGRSAEVVSAEYTGPAEILDLDEHASLVLGLPDGRVTVIATGEIALLPEVL